MSNVKEAEAKAWEGSSVATSDNYKRLRTMDNDAPVPLALALGLAREAFTAGFLKGVREDRFSIR